jgi:tetratricopeptide (TPR) repeat protein
MKLFIDLLGMLAFQSRAHRERAERQSFILGLICFAAGFLAFDLARSSVLSSLPDFSGISEPLEPFFHLFRTLLFFLLVYIPAVIVLSNTVSGDGLGLAVSGQEYRTQASALLPLWGLLFLVDAPLQYFAPLYLIIRDFGITVGMLVLLLLLLVYTGWSIKQLNYLSIPQAVIVFLLSWLTVPIYYFLISSFRVMPFFIMIWLFYLGYQWLRGHFPSHVNEKSFQQNLYALTLNPQDADAHYQLGLIHLKRRNLDTARRYFQNALKIDAADADYHYFLGRTCELSGEWALALEQYEETYRINPEYGLGDIFREVGKGYLHTGSIEKGIEFLKFFLAKRDSDPEGRYWLAVALQKCGDIEQVGMQLNAILDQARSNPRFFRKENREWIYKARSMLRNSRSQS